ncbi:MAG: prolipoprotein diacylglyceryl transferase [Candidatus Omnitrophica bacterium]|nr:prolipoprotein diacylglyceryl transferase [Candidatus Omnitrophota bacterium]
MLPEICQIGPFTIYSYGFMLVLAFFAGSYLASLQAKREGLDPDLIFNLCFLVFISGIIGARIFYVLNDFSFYLRNPLQIIMLQHGGLAWFGGAIFGALAAVLFIKKNKLGLLRILDLLAPFIALGQAIGRIGCLLNGCCFGRASKLGIYFKTFDQVLIPTQLYSSLLLLFIFFVLRFMQDRKHLPGQVLCAYLFLYSIKRFFIEYFRSDSPRIFHGLTIFQLLSLAMFIISLLVLIKIAYDKKKLL